MNPGASPNPSEMLPSSLCPTEAMAALSPFHCGFPNKEDLNSAWPRGVKLIVRVRM